MDTHQIYSTMRARFIVTNGKSFMLVAVSSWAWRMPPKPLSIHHAPLFDEDIRQHLTIHIGEYRFTWWRHQMETFSA